MLHVNKGRTWDRTNFWKKVWTRLPLNPILADVFSRMNLMERRGSGLRKILDSYMGFESYSEKLLPKFQSTNSEFIVILQNLNYHSGDKKWR